MAPKKRKAIVKKAMPKKQDGGINPLLVALGAGAGAGVGAVRGRAAGRRSALRDIKTTGSYPTTEDLKRFKQVASGTDGWGGTRYTNVADRFGTGAMSEGYKARVGGLAGEWIGDNMASEAKREFPSQRRVGRYAAKTIAKATVAKRGKIGAKKGAVKGAAGGAIAALAAAILAEMNKK